MDLVLSKEKLFTVLNWIYNRLANQSRVPFCPNSFK